MHKNPGYVCSHSVAIMALIACAVAAPAPAQLDWTDVTPASMILGGTSRGGAWADYDNDGDLDLYVSVWNAPNHLYRNDGGGVFVDVSMAPLNDAGYGGRAAWADYDNDGDLDMVLAQSQGSNLFRNDGGGVFVDVAPGEPVEMSGVLARGASWGDMDNDGLVDLYMAVRENDLPSNSLFHNAGSDTFTNITSGDLLTNVIGRGCTLADYDNDGDLDIFLPAGQPAVNTTYDQTIDKLFRNNGDGTFTDVSAPPINSDSHSRGSAWGDYDNDGDLDLAVATWTVNGVGGDDHIYRNNGDGTFTEVTPATLLDNEQSRSVAWMDIDNDGDLDLYWGYRGPNRLFLNDGAGNFTEVTSMVPALANTENCYGTSFADYDADGDLDVYITNTSGQNRLIRNDLNNGNHWAIFDLTGTISNRSAIGARITVTTGSLTQIREINSGSSYLDQHMIPAHFGLGAATVIDEVSIRWPSGQVQVLTNLAVDQIHDIIEPNCPGDADGDGTVTFDDLTLVLGNFGTSVPPGTIGDVNGDGMVDFDDLTLVLGNFGATCP